MSKLAAVMQATRMKMSATRTGVALSSETRARIAATQRRRHAASRVLQAVEAFHREWDVAKHSGKDVSKAGCWGHSECHRQDLAGMFW